VAILSTAAAVCYQIDARASQFTVKALASGLISVIAHSPTFAIRDIAGEASFEPDSLAQASLWMSANPTGFELKDEVTNDERRVIHRVMHDEVLQSSRYPNISFESRQVSAVKLGENLYRATIVGNLTLHGVTRQITLPAQAAIGDDSIRAIGDFTILQTDFGMNIVSIANSTLRLKDELKLNFFIVARRKK
jgi:polyisoprenoid-binding protein YceI